MSSVFAGPMPNVVAGAAFIALLGAACASDLRARRVPNTIVLSLAALGLVFSVVREPVITGAALALSGAATGLAIWLPFWLLRMVGAGDVKLFAAAAAWLGPSSAVEGALLAALFGGAIAFVAMLARGGTSYTLVRLAQGMVRPQSLADAPALPGARTLPYALAISAGVCTAAWFPGVLL